jgi:nucleoside-diphosphate-sugar epimerase
MTNKLHVVLGGTGAVGRGVILELKNRKLPVRAVERSKKVPGVDTIHADLLNPAQTEKALEGATHAYLCVGIPYSSKTWKAEWPVVMKNVIDACAKVNAKLIFLDNIYMYGPAPLSVPFNESHPQNPSSKKGKVRKQIADTLLEAHRAGKVKAVIGRSADFYGPMSVNSMFYTVFLENMLKKKDPQWIGGADVKHTYAYSLDNGRALVALATDESTYGQVWHLPVNTPVTPDKIAGIFNLVLGTKYTIQYMPRTLLRILSLFVPILKEVKEMGYQFTQDYVLSWDKFHEHFPGFQVTPYEEGIRGMVDSFRKLNEPGTGR